MADFGASKESTATAVMNARRSTRIFQAVPLSVSGQTRIGNLFLESTSAVAVNCHGCLYPSRHEYRHGSWVTLEVPNQQANTLPRPVRAQVKFIRLPRSPQELYLVGVELESPANVWGIKSAPQDWVQFPMLSNSSADPSPTAISTAEPASPSSPEPRSEPIKMEQIKIEQKIHILPDQSAAGDPVVLAGVNGEPVPSPPSIASARSAGQTTQPAPIVAPVPAPSEQLMRLLEGKLQQAAEKAVASILTARLNSAVNQSVKAIENFSQATVRQVEAHCLQYRETLVGSVREELLCRLQADLAEAGDHLRKQVETFSSKTLENIQQLEKSAAQVQPLVMEAQTSLHRLTEELQERFSARLREAADRAAAEFNEETGRVSQHQLGRLAEKVHTAGGEAARLLDNRSTEARSQFETAAGIALAEFREKAKIEVEVALHESRAGIDACLTSLTGEMSANWESRRRACQDELVQAGERQVEEFRRRLANIVSSSMIASISAVNEHSSALLDTLAKEAGQQLRQPLPETSRAESSS